MFFIFLIFKIKTLNICTTPGQDFKIHKNDKNLWELIPLLGATRSRARTRIIIFARVVEGGLLRQPAELHLVAIKATAVALPGKTSPSGGRPKGGVPVAPPPYRPATLPIGELRENNN